MPQPSILGQSNKDAAVAPILQTEEKATKAQIPNVFNDIVSTLPSPTKLFQNYTTTGNPVFKQAAGNALSALRGFATKSKSMLSTTPQSQPSHVQEIFENLTGTNPALQYKSALGTDPEGWSVPATVPNKYKDAIYNTAKQNGLDPEYFGNILMKESNGDPMAIHKNKDGTVDQGLMQINSSMTKKVSQYFMSQGQHFDPFNPNDSIKAAAYLMNENRQELSNALGRPPTQKELVDAYHVGVPIFLKAIQGNVAVKNILHNYEQDVIPES